MAILNGSNSSDTLVGGVGQNSLVGGAGDDRYVVDITGANVTSLVLGTIIDTQGLDTLIFSGTTAEMTAIAGSWYGIRRSGTAGSDLVVGVFNNNANPPINGAVIQDQYLYSNGQFQNTIDTIRINTPFTNGMWREFNLAVTGPNANYLIGTSGSDFISGFAGNQTLVGGGGDDAMTASRFDDQVSSYGALVGDKLYGGDGQDELNGRGGNDSLYGGSGDDTLAGNGGNDMLDGGAGSDKALFGGNFSDYDISFNATTRQFQLIDKRVASSSTNGTDLVSGVEIFSFADVSKQAYQLNVNYGVDLNGSADAAAWGDSGFGPHYYWQNSNEYSPGYQRAPGSNMWKAEVGLAGGIRALRISTTTAGDSLPSNVRLSWKLGWDNVDPSTGEPVAPLAPRIDFANPASASQTFKVWDSSSSTYKNMTATASLRSGATSSYDLTLRMADGSVASNELMTQALRNLYLGYQDGSAPAVHNRLELSVQVSVSNDANLQTWVDAVAGQAGSYKFDFGNDGPQAFAAHYNGQWIQLAFKSSDGLPANLADTSQDWHRWMGNPDKSLFKVMVDGHTGDIRQIAMFNGGLLLQLNETIPSGSPLVSISYSDPAGNQVKNVIQDWRGNDSPSFANLVATAYSGPGMTSQALSGAVMGAQLPFSDGTGIYFSDAADLGRDVAATVLTVGASTYKVRLVGLNWDLNPSFDPLASSGFQSMKYSRESISLEMVKPAGASLVPGQTIPLQDLLQVSRNEQVIVFTGSAMATNSLSSDGTQYDYHETAFATPVALWHVATGLGELDWSNDLLIGTPVDDVLLVGGGQDTLRGGSGNDRYEQRFLSGFIDARIEDAAGRNDVFVYTAIGDTKQATLRMERVGNDLVLTSTAWSDGRLLERVTIANQYTTGTIEHLELVNDVGTTIGSFLLSTSLIGTADGEMVIGSSAADNLMGNAGDDIVMASAGDDTLDGGEGNDLLVGGVGSDQLRGGLGNDVYVFNRGEQGDDVVWDDAGVNELRILTPDVMLDAARQGNDLVLKTYSQGVVVGTVTLSSQYTTAGIKTLTLSQATGDLSFDFVASLTGGSGNDWLVGTDGAESVVGGAGDDLLLAGNGADVLEGGAGNDRLLGGGGNDTAKFSGNFNQYVIRWDAAAQCYLVNDLRAGMDGRDLVAGVESLQFKDVTKPVSDLTVGLGVDLNGALDQGTHDSQSFGPYAYWESNWTTTGYQRAGGINFYRAEVGLASGIKAVRISADTNAAELSQKGVALDWRLGWDSTSQSTGEYVAPYATRIAFGGTGSAKQTFLVYDPSSSTNVSFEASYATHDVDGKTITDLIIQAADHTVVSSDLMQSALRAIGLVYRDPAAQALHNRLEFNLSVNVSADLQTWSGAGDGQLDSILAQLDNAPAHLLAAKYNGRVISLSLDDGVNLPESLPNVLDGEWNSWVGHPDKSLFSVTVNGRPVSVLNAVMADSGVCLLLSEDIPQNAAAVSVTYTDPVGNQTQHVIQDRLGNDTATTTLPASYFAGAGIKAEILAGAESGINLFGNSDGPYFQDGAYLSMTDLGRVTAVSATTVTLLLESSSWGQNPSYVPGSTTGLAQYSLTHDRLVFELVKPANSTLVVGSTLSLKDLVEIDSTYRVSSITLGLSATNSMAESGVPFELARYTLTTPLAASGIVTGNVANAWGNDTQLGGAKDDTLFYSGGVDSLAGGTGNDTYRIVNDLGSGSVVIDDAGGTQDTLAAQNLKGGLAQFTAERAGNDLVLKGYDWDTGVQAFVMTIKNQYTTGTIEKLVCVNEVGVWGAAMDMSTSKTGGAGNEYIFGTALADTLSGGGGNDDLYGAGGNDSMLGGDGDDVLRSGAGSDTMDGGLGKDTYRWVPRDLGQDVIQDAGGTGDGLRIDASGYRLDAERQGSDLLLTAYSNGVLASSVLLKGQWSTQAIESITETNPYGSSETISFRSDGVATTGNDWIVGDSTADTLGGNAGTDWLFGGGGNDVMTGGAGNDRLAGGEGQDIAVFTGTQSAYTWTASNGGYQITGPDGVDQLMGIETLRFSDGDVSLGSLHSGVHLSVVPKFWKNNAVIQGVTPYVFKTESVGSGLLKVQINTDLNAGTFAATISNGGTEPLRSFGFVLDLDASVAATASLSFSSKLSNWTTVNDAVSHRVGGYSNQISTTNYIQVDEVMATVTGKLPALLQDQAILALTSVETNSAKDATGTMLKMDVTDGVTTQAGKIVAYDIYNLAPGQYSVNIPSSAYAIPEGTVTADDAFKALELALGMNTITSTTPYELMAADINQDGRVTAFDAYSLLQVYAQSANALPQEFVFIDPSANLSALSRLNVKYTEGRLVSQSDPGDIPVDLVGVLLGDVTGSYGAI